MRAFESKKTKIFVPAPSFSEGSYPLLKNNQIPKNALFAPLYFPLSLFFLAAPAVFPLSFSEQIGPVPKLQLCKKSRKQAVILVLWQSFSFAFQGAYNEPARVVAKLQLCAAASAVKIASLLIPCSSASCEKAKKKYVFQHKILAEKFGGFRKRL